MLDDVQIFVNGFFSRRLKRGERERTRDREKREKKKKEKMIDFPFRETLIAVVNRSQKQPNDYCWLIENYSNKKALSPRFDFR